MTAARAQRRARRGTGWRMPNLGDIDAQTVAGGARHRHPRHRRRLRLPVHLRRGARRWSPAPARCCAAPADEHPDVFAAARVGARRARRPHRGDPALRGRVHPARRRTPDRRWPTCWPSFDELIAGNDHVEFYWMPVHRPGADQAQQPGTGRRPAAVAGWRGWLDDDFLSNTVFGGVCRLGRAVPAAGPGDQRGRRPGPSPPRTYTGPLRPGLLHAAPGPVRGDGVRAARATRCPRRSPRCAGSSTGLPFKVLFPVEVRFTAADDIWLSHGVRPGQRLHRHPPVRRHAVRAVLPGLRGRCARRWAAGRTGASCTTATPRRWPRRTRASPTSWPCATGSTPHRVFTNPHLNHVLGV